jgi:hypothetical protein
MSGSQFWWFRYTRDGKRHAVSLRTPDEGVPQKQEGRVYTKQKTKEISIMLND